MLFGRCDWYTLFYRAPVEFQDLILVARHTLKARVERKGSALVRLPEVDSSTSLGSSSRNN